MARNQIRVFGVNLGLNWVVLAAVYPFICYALYRDMKAELPLYYIVLACFLGAVMGLFLIIKIVNPAMRYLDEKVERWFNVKK